MERQVGGKMWLKHTYFKIVLDNKNTINDPNNLLLKPVLSLIKITAISKN